MCLAGEQRSHRCGPCHQVEGQSCHPGHKGSWESLAPGLNARPGQKSCHSIPPGAGQCGMACVIPTLTSARMGLAQVLLPSSLHFLQRRESHGVAVRGGGRKTEFEDGSGGTVGAGTGALRFRSASGIADSSTECACGSWGWSPPNCTHSA